MKVGDYVRTDIGEIRKVVRVTDDLYVLDKDIVFAHKDKIKKTSPNIIDLIEVGDYVNGHKVVDIAEATKRAVYIEDVKQKSGLIPYTRDNIKSILTKEQFESMEYKVC